MNPLVVVEVLAVVVIITGGWTQIILPLLRKQNIFPFFKKNRVSELEHELARAREEKTELELQIKLQKAEAEILERQQELQKVQAENLESRLESLKQASETGSSMLETPDIVKSEDRKKTFKSQGLRQ